VSVPLACIMGLKPAEKNTQPAGVVPKTQS
jgi:hypothetical protein